MASERPDIERIRFSYAHNGDYPSVVELCNYALALEKRARALCDAVSRGTRSQPAFVGQGGTAPRASAEGGQER